MVYEIKALRGQDFVTLMIEASTQELAIAEVRGQGYSVIAAREPHAKFLFSLHDKKFPLVLFSQELLTLLEAGLNLLEALEALSEKEFRTEIKQVLSGIVKALNEGKTISVAMESYPKAFPQLYIAALKASEKTGGLTESLKRYIAYQSQVEMVKKKVISASIYPIILMLTGGLVTLFLMAYVVPRFAHIYEEVGSNLPFLSGVLLAWGDFLNENGGYIGIFLLVFVIASVFILKQDFAKKRLVELAWKIPALGERLRIIQLSRFYRSLSMLLISGIPIMSALNMVSGLLAPPLRIKLKSAASLISEGQPISLAMETNGLSTPIALRMLRVGERSGMIGEMMERVASFYDEETARWIDWFTKLFEPLLMLVIGVVIGMVVLLLYMPIFDLAGSIQ